ncbi:MAG: hypothetical protein JST54_05710 [Deltaproteobacteria bacterium]|nr:hypothetical protein [Deltaproteobacteria bacterium]
MVPVPLVEAPVVVPVAPTEAVIVLVDAPVLVPMELVLLAPLEPLEVEALAPMAPDVALELEAPVVPAEVLDVELVPEPVFALAPVLDEPPEPLQPKVATTMNRATHSFPTTIPPTPEFPFYPTFWRPRRWRDGR